MESNDQDARGPREQSAEASVHIRPVFPNGLTEEQEQQLLGLGIRLLELQHYMINQFPDDPRIATAWLRIEEARLWIGSRLAMLEEVPTSETLERLREEVIAAGTATGED